MPSITLDTSFASGNSNTTGRATITGQALIEIDVPMTSEQADEEIDLSFLTVDLAAGCLLFFSDVPVTLETNSTSVPDDTFEVAAGGSTRVTALAEHITTLFATNGAATAGTLKIRGVKDATP